MMPYIINLFAMARRPIAARIFRLLPMLSSAPGCSRAVGDGLALTVEILEDAHAEFFRLEEAPLPLADAISGLIQSRGGLQHAVALRLARGGVHVVQLRAARSWERSAAAFAALAARRSRACAASRLCISKLGQERGLDRGVLQGTRLEVHAPDQRLSLRDVRLDEPDALGLGVCDGGGARVGVSRAGVEDETTEGRVFVRARVAGRGDAPPSRLGKEAVLRAMEAVNSRNSFS